MSKPSTFVYKSFLFCESTELSRLSKDENNKTNLPECFWEKIPELLVIDHKSMRFPVQNPGFDSGIEGQGNSLTPHLSLFFGLISFIRVFHSKKRDL
jgi:hypothetical protein